MFKSLAIAGARLRTVVLAVLILGSALSAGPVSAQEQCIEGACVSAGPRLVELDTAQSALLNPLLQALLPGTSINLSVADWNALADADIDLNLLLTQLAADVGVSDPSQVLEADITLGQLLLAAANVLEADGQTLAASVLRNILNPQLGGLAGTINLIDLLRIDLPTGSLAGIELDVLDLLTGMVQLYNFSNVVTTPQPITIDTGALGLPGITAVELWAQVVEPPVYACGSEGTQFYSAAVRTKLNVQAVNTAPLQPIVDALDGLSLLGLVSLENVSLGAEVLNLELYADVARAEGVLSGVDALASAVTLQARPGLANLYLGTISDSIFWNRSSVITEAVVEPTRLTDLGLTAEVRLLSIIGQGLQVAGITGDIGVDIRAVAQGSPDLVTTSVSGPFPATVTMASGTVSIGSLLTSLLDDLELTAQGEGLVVNVFDVIPIDLDPNALINAILGVVQPLLSNALVPLLGTLLDLILGDIVDTLLQLLGIQVGQATFTVEGIARSCVAELVLAKQLDPVDAPGLFDLAISQGGTVLASAAGAGHGTATAPVLTEAGATYGLAETAADGFDLASYATTWACTAPDGTELDSGTGPAFDFIAPDAGPEPVTITCSFINRLRQASVSVTKTDGSPTYIPGTTATYLITVANAGPDAASGISISDTLPAGASLADAWSCTATGGSCGSASGGAPGETEVSVVLDLEPDGQAEISVPVQFSPDPSDY